MPEAETMAEAERVPKHSEFYYKLFKNGDESTKPVPVFTRSVRGVSFGPYHDAQKRAKIRLQRAGLLDPSIDDTHCECASWF
jgi:hypothetical protein